MSKPINTETAASPTQSEAWDAAWDEHSETPETPPTELPEGTEEEDPAPVAGEGEEPPPIPSGLPHPAPAPNPELAASLAELARAQATTQQAIGSMADQMRQVRAEAAVAVQTPGGPSAEAIALASKDPESWSKFKSEWSDWASPIEELFDHRIKAALAAVAPAVDAKALKEELRAEMKLERERERQEEQEAEKKRVQFQDQVTQARATVLKAHPDFDAERMSEPFKAWVKEQPPGIRNLGASWDPADAITMMNMYKQSRPTPRSADSVHAARQARLRQTAAPSRSTQVGAPRNGGNPFDGLNWDQAWEMDTQIKDRARA